jgi:hypothetical protein
MKTGHVYSMNCDCGSYHEVRQAQGRWIDGPRCRRCGAILGWMQWAYLGKASGVNDAEIITNAMQAYREAARKER